MGRTYAFFKQARIRQIFSCLQNDGNIQEKEVRNDEDCEMSHHESESEFELK